jgi:hypothetical protein
VPDVENVVLCKRCVESALKYKYTIARGHDYGRKGNLPRLNENTLSAITPARAFNIEINMHSSHAKGNAIVFPSNGAVSVSTVLPDMSPGRRLHSSFIGSATSWKQAAKIAMKEYEVDAETAYSYLRVWKALHPEFKHITIIDTPEMRAKLAGIAEETVSQAIVNSDLGLQQMNEHVSRDLDKDDDHAVRLPTTPSSNTSEANDDPHARIGRDYTAYAVASTNAYAAMSATASANPGASSAIESTRAEHDDVSTTPVTPLPSPQFNYRAVIRPPMQLLPRGRTVHSMFGLMYEGTTQTNIDDMYIAIGAARLSAIVIDESSMLDAAHLQLINLRLQTMYDNTTVSSYTST